MCYSVFVSARDVSALEPRIVHRLDIDSHMKRKLDLHTTALHGGDNR